MEKTILFLGAGMSNTFGYPLTREIFPLIVEGLKKQTLFSDVTNDRKIAALYRKLLTNLFTYLSPGLKFIFNLSTDVKKIKDDLPLVTELLSQLDHFILTNQSIVDWNFEIKDPLLRFTKISERWELTDIKILFEWAIINVINKPKEQYSKKISDFLQWLTKTNKSKTHFYSIISANYDVSLEWELLDYGQAWDADEEIDFGCSWRDPVLDNSVVHKRPTNPIYRILKLHGSTDWLKCERCGFIYINPTENIYKLSFSNRKTHVNSCHCGYWPLKPVLITPSYVRQMNDSSLSEIWRNALEDLRTADRWIIVGYSLPSEDFDIKSLFLRALAGKEKDLAIKVIQNTTRSKRRYDMFFGENNYEFVEGGFENYIDQLISPQREKNKKDPINKVKKR